MHKRLLITGCGRSGTLYTSVLLGRCGLEVLHEKQMGKDGISSWLFGVQASTVPWGPPPTDYTFDHIIHLVRDPLSAIPSIATSGRLAWEYISRHVPIEPSDSLILRSAKYWLYWNGMVESRTDIRLKIEDMPGAVVRVCDRVGLKVDLARITQVPKDLNTRRLGRLFNLLEGKCLERGVVRENALLKKLLSWRLPMYDDITWNDLHALDPSLTAKIQDKALDYGYGCAADKAGIRGGPNPPVSV